MGYEVVQIDEQTWRIEDNQTVRFFLLTGSERALLIDSGMTITNAREIAGSLTELPLMLINTHGDRDHVASNHQFESFYMHPSECSNYYKTQGKTGRFIPVEDGQMLDLGDRKLKIISIPGHTPGSIAILDMKSRTLFSGDPIQDGMIFMFGTQREMHAYRESLKKLEACSSEFDTIYPSHGTVPVAPSLISELYRATEDLLTGEFSYQEIEMFGEKVKCVDVGVARYLLD